jgi:hypothetical protein
MVLPEPAPTAPGQLFFMIGHYPDYTSPVIVAQSFDRAELIERARACKFSVVAATVVYDGMRDSEEVPA